MEKQERIRSCMRLYEQLTRHSVDGRFVFPQGGKSEKVVADCLDKLDIRYARETDREEVVDYCVFQVYFWRDVVCSKIKWQVGHSFGSKALARYIDRKAGCRYYENEWLHAHKLKREHLWSKWFPPDIHPYTSLVYAEAEERTKRRLAGTEAGYIICSIATTMWSPLSECCRSCSQRNRCMQRTAVLYPELYRLRVRFEKDERERNGSFK